MSTIRVGFISHSYGRDLESTGISKGRLQQGISYEIKFFHESGSCFDYWINWPQQLHDCIEYRPHILFICLGGNSIKETIRVKSLKEKANIFYKIIKNNLSETKIVACQVESRFLTVTNSHGTPPFARYIAIRNKFNKAIQESQERDFMLCIAGKNRLDDRKYYKNDRIHMNDIGLKKYMRSVLHTIEHINSVSGPFNN